MLLLYARNFLTKPAVVVLIVRIVPVEPDIAVVPIAVSHVAVGQFRVLLSFVRFTEHRFHSTLR